MLSEQAAKKLPNGTKVRLRLIVVLWTLAFVFFLGLQLISRRAVDRSAEAVDERAATATATPEDVLGDMFNAADGRIAARLGVDPTWITVSQPHPPAYCVAVRVHRIIAERTLTYRLADNRFQRIARC
jgi:hypothetical protein